MKDSIILKGKIYISAKRASTIFGYSSDYIGQLCRASKIDCHLMGKNWFIFEKSLHDYKLSNDKSSLDSSNKDLNIFTPITPITNSINSDSVDLSSNADYVSAKSASIIFDYSSDYIGQLCRAGKLECTMVGKSWFVSKKSILKHKLINSEIIKTNTNIGSESNGNVLVNNLAINFSNSNVVSKDNENKNRIKSSISNYRLFNYSLVLFLLFIFVYAGISIYPSINLVRDNIVSNALNGLAIAPASKSELENEKIKSNLKNPFSDEVSIRPDGNTGSGIITPVFKETKGNDFLYVMVPVKEKKENIK